MQSRKIKVFISFKKNLFDLKLFNNSMLLIGTFTAIMTPIEAVKT